MGNTPTLDPSTSGTSTHNTKSSETQSKSKTLNTISNRRNPGKLAIIDNRSCLREALAVALREHMDKPIIALDSIDTLLASPDEFNPDISTIVIATSAVEQSELNGQIASLREYLPSAFIVLLTDNYDDFTYSTYKRNGLNGVIPSSYRTEQVYLCLCAIESGIKFLPPETREKDPNVKSLGGDGNARKLPDLDGLLTPRQQEVLRYIAEGRSNKYIAAELSLCESTVKVHVSEVMRRLGATSRTHATYLISNFDTTSLRKPTD